MTDHTCTTSDGVPIEVGLIVFNNDLKPVRVTEEPRLYGDDRCDGAGHGATNRPANCWWGTTRPDGARAGEFDGSRMVTVYNFRDGPALAQDAYEGEAASAGEAATAQAIDDRRFS